MYEGAADIDSYLFHKKTKQFSTFVPHPLCQPAFKTDIVKIKMDTKTIDDWNEIDYVRLHLSTQPLSPPFLTPLPRSRSTAPLSPSPSSSRPKPSSTSPRRT